MSWKQSKVSYGTDESFYPFKFPVSKLSEQEIHDGLLLSPQERIDWLIMMQELLWEQYKTSHALLKK